MAITRATGFPVGGHPPTIGSPSANDSTLAITVQAIGDLVVVFCSSGTASAVASSVLDSNSRITWGSITTSQTWAGEHLIICSGVATSTGATNVTVRWNNVPTFNYLRIDSWNGGAGQTWTAGTPGTSGRSGSGTTADYPSLSATANNSLYEGFVVASATLTSATDAFTHSLLDNSEMVYQSGITIAGSPYLPGAATGTAMSFNGVAAIFSVTTTGAAVNVTAREDVVVTDDAEAFVPQIVPTDIEFRGSGASNLGGAIAAVLTGGVNNNLWDDVTAGESTAGDTEYRCIYIRNNHPFTTWLASVVWIDAMPTVGTIAIGLDSAAPGATAVSASANETAVPSPTITFASPITKVDGLDLGDIPAQSYQAIWIRRTIPTGNTTAASDWMSLRVEVESP